MVRKKKEFTKVEITPELQDFFQEALGNKPSNGWPKISQGTHLTVKTFEDGHTELVWDDEQLLKEVREAIASVKKPNVKAKVEVQKKKQKAKSEVLNSVEQSMKAIEKAKATAKKTTTKGKTK